MQGCPIFRRSIGRSVQGREIEARATFDFAGSERTGGGTLIIGGMHGNEPATVALLERFEQGATWESPLRPPAAIIAAANPDGLARGTRYNARGVDLNRNCDWHWEPEGEEPPGPRPWSEPESVALREFILAWRPAKIVSLHWALAEIDADGEQSTPLAFAMWEALDPLARQPYRVRVTEPDKDQNQGRQSYAACPGSLGQWCGYGLHYPDGSRPAMITLELPYDPQATARPEVLPEDHLEMVRELWRRDAAAYLQEVFPGVQAMLATALRFPARS